MLFNIEPHPELKYKNLKNRKKATKTKAKHDFFIKYFRKKHLKSKNNGSFNQE